MGISKDKKRKTYTAQYLNEKGQWTKKRGFREKADAEYFLAQQKVKQRSSSNTSDITFKELLNDYIAYKKSYLRISSFEAIQKKIKNHITNYFDVVFLQQIKAVDIKNWHMALIDKQLSVITIKKIHSELVAIFNYANKFYDIDNNEIRKTSLIKLKKQKNQIQVWSKEDFLKFIKVIDDSDYSMLFHLLYYTGMRIGELLALRWINFNFDNNTLHIKKTIANNIGGQKWIENDIKNYEEREIKLDIKTANKLKAYYNNEDKNCFIFGKNAPFHRNTISKKKNEYCKIAEVKQIRLHDFRHSHASLLISLGADIVLVANRLGHKDIKMTLNTYSHLLPSRQDEILLLLEK